jgi:hypothetical protein
MVYLHIIVCYTICQSNLHCKSSLKTVCVLKHFTVLSFKNYTVILLTVLCGLQFLIRKFPFCGCRSNLYFHVLLQILWIYSRLCLIKSPPPPTSRPNGLDCACMFQLGPLHHTAAQCYTQLHYSCTVLHTAALQLHSAAHSCTT